MPSPGQTVFKSDMDTYLPSAGMAYYSAELNKWVTDLSYALDDSITEWIKGASFTAELTSSGPNVWKISGFKSIDMAEALKRNYKALPTAHGRIVYPTIYTDEMLESIGETLGPHLKTYMDGMKQGGISDSGTLIANVSSTDLDKVQKPSIPDDYVAIAKTKVHLAQNGGTVHYVYPDTPTPTTTFRTDIPFKYVYMSGGTITQFMTDFLIAIGNGNVDTLDKMRNMTMAYPLTTKLV